MRSSTLLWSPLPCTRGRGIGEGPFREMRRCRSTLNVQPSPLSAGKMEPEMRHAQDNLAALCGCTRPPCRLPPAVKWQASTPTLRYESIPAPPYDDDCPEHRLSLTMFVHN